MAARKIGPFTKDLLGELYILYLEIDPILAMLLMQVESCSLSGLLVCLHVHLSLFV